MYWDWLVRLDGVPGASGLIRGGSGPSLGVLMLLVAGSGVVLRVREEPLAFAKKDFAVRTLFFAFAKRFSRSRRRKFCCSSSDFRGSYLAIYKEFGDDPKMKVVDLGV